MMKILHILSSCAKVSGVAQVVMRYYQHLHKDITFDFLMFDRSEVSFEDEIISYGGACYYVMRPSVFNVIKFIKEIDAFLNAHKDEYDAIQLHDLYLNSVILRIAKQKGIKVRIAHSHTTKYAESMLSSLRNRLLYMSLKRYANVFFACSKDAGKFAFGKQILGDSRFYVINNAIDITQFIYSEENRMRVREELEISSNDFVVGHVGRFTPPKNHKFLVHLFYELSQYRKDAKLLLVGVGKELSTIEALCKKLLIEDKVIFAGRRSDVGAVMSAMDVFCLPSIFEGLGNVLIEAQANSLRCVASDVVPQEAAVLPSYKTLPLNESISVWVDALLQMPTVRKADADEMVTRAGFNINDEALKVKKIYQQLCSYCD